MDDTTSLDSILNDEPNEAPEAAVEAVAEEPVSAPETPRDEQGRFAPKGEPEGASPAPVKEPELDHAALVGERRRRQEAEQRAQALETQLQSLQQAPPPSIWEDEQGWQQNFGQEVTATAVQQASLNAKLDMSEMLVRQANPDFEDVKAEFLALAEANPSLRQQALSDPHPWNKAYQIAKTHKTMTELGATDIATLEAKIEARIRAELQAQPPAAPGLPPTLTTERNVGQRSGPAWAGPKSLSELLG